MTTSKNKIKIIASTAILTLTVAALLASISPVVAHDPPQEVTTYSYTTVSPNPIGVDQTATVVFWCDKMPPTASGKGGDRYTFKVEVTKPDGTEKTVGTFTSDPVGSGYTQFTPTQTGEYTFTVTMNELEINGYHPETDVPGDLSSAYINDTFLSSSDTTTLTVQEDPADYPPTYPLPTEYWARPIEGQNVEWYKVASHWLAGSHTPNSVQKDGVAPDSAHIMWTKPLRDGGVVGGMGGMTYYDGTQYENVFMDPIIIHGRLYYTEPLGSAMPRFGAGASGDYLCVDLRTGEEIWSSDEIGRHPSFGQIYDYESMNQHGAIPNGYLWSTDENPWAALFGFPTGPTTWKAYDPLTGEPLFNITSIPSGTEVYTQKGEITRYVLNTQGNWLALWDNTAVHGLTGAQDPTDTTSTNYYQWRPIGKTVNASQAYLWNVTIPTDLPPNAGIRGVIPGDLLLVTTPYASFMEAGTGSVTAWAISLEEGTRGDVLWEEHYPAMEGLITRSFKFVDPVNHVFIVWDKETIQYSAYSLDDGSLLWTTSSENPWNMYSGGGGAIQTETLADGKLYSTGYSGNIYCYNTSDGKLLWEYDTNSDAGFATPYPGYPLGIAAVADGKIYIHVNEHSSGAPYWKGAQLYCFDADNGDKLWTINAHGGTSYGDGGYAIADGYLVFINLYDMQIYSIGKGPSQTTVTAEPKTVAQGSSVVIEGTVIDIAAGTQQHEQAARFPHGVPAMSDDSMGEWMEYVYMQKPQPEDAEGVKVTLDAINPSGEFVHIGETTSDMSGTYSYIWQPEMEGKYTIIATFEGSDSYYASYDPTAIAVNPAPAEAVSPTEQPAWYEEPASPTERPTWYEEPVSPTEQPAWYEKPVKPPDYTMLFAGIIIAIIVIAILVIYDIMIHRQRK